MRNHNCISFLNKQRLRETVELPVGFAIRNSRPLWSVAIVAFQVAVIYGGWGGDSLKTLGHYTGNKPRMFWNTAKRDLRTDLLPKWWLKFCNVSSFSSNLKQEPLVRISEKDAYWPGLKAAFMTIMFHKIRVYNSCHTNVS